MMTIDQILTKLDHYYKEDQLTEIEPFLLSCLEDAKKEQEYGIYISVGNELLGFYRSIGQFEAAFAVGEDVLLLMEELQLDHTVHFATTLFNVATAYRTAGKYEEALANYRRALEIYQKELPKDDYRLAELYSSISILLEKLNENENAALFLEKAIQIMEKQPGTRVEVATSRTSLALIELKMDKLEEAEKEKNKAATREELMERSYKMAAKYLNPDKDTVQEKAVGKEPTETVPVQRAEYQTTSGLSQPVTDSAYIASLTVERNYGFNTAVGSSYQMGTNTIAACISENQTIEQGGRVRLRLLQPLQAGSITVPENSLVTGAAVIQGERLDILISSIEYAGNIIPVQLATYDIDGQKGIFVPGSETRNAAKDAAGTVSESMGNSVSFARSAGQQVVMDLTRGVMQGGTRLIAGRVRAVKVTLKAGYKVLLVTKKQ